jgi:drug/metabolite transporter (DMT)-like permease
MRDQPTWRIPAGVLLLLGGLALYAVGVVLLSPLIERLPVLAQTVVYLVLGIVWLLPLRRFLIWMETGRFSPPG